MAIAIEVIRAMIRQAKDTHACVVADLAVKEYIASHPGSRFPASEMLGRMVSALKTIGQWDYELERKMRAEAAGAVEAVA
jgi:hypothetical protein